MSSSPVDNPAFRVLMKALGLSPRDHEFRLEGSLESVQRILFVDSGQFADLLFFLPVIQEIRERWPSVAVQVMVEERWGDFLKREPGIEGIILYDPESLRFRSSAYRKLLREVKKRSFDAVVLMGTEEDSHRDLVAFASGVSLRAGAYSEGRERILNCMVRWTGKERYRSCFAQELSRLLGLRFEASKWRYCFRPEEVRAADQLIHFRKPSRDVLLIGVDPGAGLAEHQLVESHLAFLLNHLTETLKARPLIFQIQGERSGFREKLRGDALEMPPLGLRERLALLSRCDLFVAGNTELFHAATAFGVPTLGLFTESDRPQWEPRDRPEVSILRGRPGEKISLKEMDERVQEILKAGRGAGG